MGNRIFQGLGRKLKLLLLVEYLLLCVAAGSVYHGGIIAFVCVLGTGTALVMMTAAFWLFLLPAFVSNTQWLTGIINNKEVRNAHDC